jgi:hypothetical protein
MSIRLNGSTSGYTEIDAPAVAGSNTLVLPTGNGTADQVLAGNGSGALSFVDRGRMVLETAQATTSGPSKDFTGIPSWVKKITVMFSGVSLSGTSSVLVQIGTSSGVQATGYAASSTGTSGSAGSTLSSTSGFIVRLTTAPLVVSGHMVLTHAGANLWIQSHSAKLDTTASAFGGGDKTLSDTLTQLRITTVNGTDTFDAGSINILVEG